MAFALAVYTPGPTDATSFYRGIRPLARLKKQLDFPLYLSFVGETNWASLDLVDAAFMQRPFTPNHLQTAHLIKQQRLPLWVDYDDFLFAVPRDNPTFEIYGKEAVHKNIAQICAMADIITVSTPELHKQLAKLNPNIVVVPNAIDDARFSAPVFGKEPRKKIILWRGSKTHTRDLMEYANEIVDLAAEAPDWTWTFIGDNPWFITERMNPKNVIATEGIDIHEYFHAIRLMRPRIQMVPLVDSTFNRCKSNIAWIEGTYAGAMTLAPDWEEWRQPGATTYATKKEFKDRLRHMMNVPEAVQDDCMHRSWSKINSEYTLSTTNELRYDVLKFLHSISAAQVRRPVWGLDASLTDKITSFEFKLNEAGSRVFQEDDQRFFFRDSQRLATP